MRWSDVLEDTRPSQDRGEALRLLLHDNEKVPWGITDGIIEQEFAIASAAVNEEPEDPGPRVV